MNGCIHCPKALEYAKEVGERNQIKVEERDGIKHFGELEQILGENKAAVPVTCLTDEEGNIDRSRCVVGAEDLVEKLEAFF